MNLPRSRWVTALLLGAGAGFGMATLVAAYDASRSSRSEKSTTKTVTSTADTSLESKLDQILANQEKILQRFDAVMEELRIIKIRASMQ